MEKGKKKPAPNRITAFILLLLHGLLFIPLAFLITPLEVQEIIPSLIQEIASSSSSQEAIFYSLIILYIILLLISIIPNLFLFFGRKWAWQWFMITIPFHIAWMIYNTIILQGPLFSIGVLPLIFIFIILKNNKEGYL